MGDRRGQSLEFGSGDHQGQRVEQPWPSGSLAGLRVGVVGIDATQAVMQQMAGTFGLEEAVEHRAPMGEHSGSRVENSRRDQ